MKAESTTTNSTKTNNTKTNNTKTNNTKTNNTKTNNTKTNNTKTNNTKTNNTKTNVGTNLADVPNKDYDSPTISRKAQKKMDSVYLIDGVSSVGVHNGVARITFTRLTTDGKPEFSHELLVPLAAMKALKEALSKVPDAPASATNRRI